MRRRRVPRTTLALLLVVGALGLSGCEVAEPDQWRFDGDPLLQADEDLASITDAWREHLQATDRLRIVPESAACYFTIEAPRTVTDQVACGPALAADGRTVFERARIGSFYERDGKVALGLIEAPQKAFTPIPRDEAGTPVAADGTLIATDEDVTPPALPELAMGRVERLPSSPTDLVLMGTIMDDTLAQDEGRRQLPVSESTVVASFAVADPAHDSAIRWAAPAGTHLVVVSVMPYLGVAALAQKDLTVTIRPGASAEPVVVDLAAPPPDDGTGAASSSDAAPSTGPSDGGASSDGGGASDAGGAGADPGDLLLTMSEVDPATGEVIAVSGPVLARYVMAVPDGEHARLELTDGVHRASASSEPGDATSDFPGVHQVMSYGAHDLFPDSTATDSSAPNPGATGASGSLTVSASGTVHEPETEGGPRALSLPFEVFSSETSVSPGLVSWIDGGTPTAVYTSIDAELTDVELTVDQQPVPAAIDAHQTPSQDPSTARAGLLTAELPSATDGIIELTGTVRVTLSTPHQIDPAVATTVPPTTVLELPVTETFLVDESTTEGPRAW